LLCCDISEVWTAVGVQTWEEAWLGDRIELRIAPALKTLRRLPHEEDIDLVFIDADKTGYVDYWERNWSPGSVRRRIPGGQRAVERQGRRPGHHR